MMGPMQDEWRLQAQRVLGNVVSSLGGVVTSYDPARYAAKVTLQPDSLQTGWLPVAAHWIGDGWGMFSPPSPGDQVNVEFINGDIGSGTVVGRIWDQNNPPLAVPAGEWWLVHKSGAFIKLTHDGKLTLDDAHGATFQLDGAGHIIATASNFTVNGPMHVTGNVQVDQTLTANTDVVGGGKHLKTHVHGGVQSGTSSTGPPA